VDVPIQTASLNASSDYQIIAGVPYFVGVGPCHYSLDTADVREASGSTNIRYYNHTITLLPAKTSKKRMDVRK
jgi:hypothetical protein